MPSYLCLTIASHDQAQDAEIQASEYQLSHEDILSSVRDTIQYAVYVDMSCRIDQGACISFHSGIVTFAFKILVHLLHVCFPVDLCILVGSALTVQRTSSGSRCWESKPTRYFPYDERTEGGIGSEQCRSYPSSISRVLGHRDGLAVDIHSLLCD